MVRTVATGANTIAFLPADLNWADTVSIFTQPFELGNGRNVPAHVIDSLVSIGVAVGVKHLVVGNRCRGEIQIPVCGNCRSARSSVHVGDVVSAVGDGHDSVVGGRDGHDSLSDGLRQNRRIAELLAPGIAAHGADDQRHRAHDSNRQNQHGDHQLDHREAALPPRFRIRFSTPHHCHDAPFQMIGFVLPLRVTTTPPHPTLPARRSWM